MLGRRRISVMTITVSVLFAAAPLFAGSTDFTQTPAFPATMPSNAFELSTPSFEHHLDIAAPVNAHLQPSTRPLDERPLVPLPTPAATGLAGLGAAEFIRRRKK